MRPRRAAAPAARVVADVRAGVVAARRAALVLTLAAVVAAGCGDRSSDPPAPSVSAAPTASPAERPAEPSDEEQIAALLDARARALETGRASAYAATATGAQRRSDRADARRAARLRLDGVTLEPLDVDVSGDRATARVELGYGVAGVRGAFVGERRIRAVRTAEGWRIAEVRGRRGLPPWESGAFEEQRSAHFVVLAPAGLDVSALTSSLEAGYGTMRALLASGRLRRRYLVVVAGDFTQAHALTSQIRGLETLAALADASVYQDGPAQRTTRVLSVRLLVVWPAFAALDAEGRGRVVTHELTHAALTGSTSGRTPAWLSEGVALYVSGDRRPAPGDPDLAALSEADAIARLTGGAQADAYYASSAAAFAIADRFGNRRLLDLYDAFNDPGLRGRAGPRLVNRALRRELGVSLAELEETLG